MPNRSTFPNKPDTFIEFHDITYSDIPHVERYQELKTQQIKSQNEEKEFNQLTSKLRDKIVSPEDWNKFCDCLVNMEIFIKDNVVGFMETKQQETTVFVNEKKNEMTNFVTDKKNEVVNFVNNKESEMTDKKDYYINLVNQKEIQLAEMDSRTRRYWQKWNSTTNGQVEYDIFTNGINLNLPQEAILNIDPENIDLAINGVPQVPYEDYDVKNDGQYRKIVIKGNAKNLITVGTEIIIKYYKNVGKLYFKHVSTHQEGGYDPIVVTEGLLDNNLKNKLFNNVIEGATKPTSKQGLTWLKTL